MSAIDWAAAEKIYEDGLDRGVLYPKVGPGVAWSGLVSIDETIVGGESTPLHYDGVKYLDIIANEDFQATLSALSAPPEFDSSNGIKALAAGLYATGQPRTTFDLSYRTMIGEQGKGLRKGYKLHLVYNCTANPTSKSSKTTTQTVDPAAQSWTIDTVPPPSSIMKPTAHFIIDSRKVDPWVLMDLENRLYGTATTAPYLPTQAEVVTILTDPTWVKGGWNVTFDPASFRGTATGTHSAAGLYIFTRFNFTTIMSSLVNLTCRVESPTTGGGNGINGGLIVTPPAGWSPSSTVNWTYVPAFAASSSDRMCTMAIDSPRNFQVTWTGLAAADFPIKFTFKHPTTPNKSIVFTLTTSAADPFISVSKQIVLT